MGEVVKFKGTLKKKNQIYPLLGDKLVNKRCKEILERLRIRNRNNQDYSETEIKILVNDILIATDYFNSFQIPNIVDIVKNFGIKVYIDEDLSDNVDGSIFINGNTEEIYEVNQVLLVRSENNLSYNRFIIAYELAYILFYYIGSNMEYDRCKLFSYMYVPNNEASKREEEKLFRFAMEILMPGESFLRDYIRAKTAALGDENYYIPYLSNLYKLERKLIEKRVKELLY